MSDERYRLSKKLERIPRYPQSTKAEDAVVELELEIAILDAKRELRVLRLQQFLYNAYRKNGSMSVIHPSGQVRTEQPEYGGHELQHIWNARGKARDLAEWATP